MAIRILVVDDDKNNRFLLNEMLKSLADISLASSVQEAIDLMEKSGKDIDLVITDLNMGDNRDAGFEVAQAVRKYKLSSKVILLTADLRENLISSAQNSGVGVVLRKPFRISDLLDEVKKLCGIENANPQ